MTYALKSNCAHQLTSLLTGTSVCLECTGPVVGWDTGSAFYCTAKCWPTLPDNLLFKVAPVFAVKDGYWCDNCSSVFGKKSYGEPLVTLLCEILSVRAGETLTPELIEERARNAAQAIMGEYKLEAR